MFHFKIFEKNSKSSLAFELKAKAMDQKLRLFKFHFLTYSMEFWKALVLRGWKNTEKKRLRVLHFLFFSLNIAKSPHKRKSLIWNQ
jgi:hypothetical protein